MKRLKQLIAVFIFILLSMRFVSAQTQKIKVYFNHPVNSSVSSGVNAVYLDETIDDTLIAYINRAHYSIDVAVYNYIQSGNMSNIAAAINHAYLNGVNIRWIYNGSSSNSGVALLDSGIHTLGSPTGGSYNIMHNKFMIIDANSVNPNDPIVWTGSCNWDVEQVDSDVNNVIIFQDSSFAHAYTAEFNQMWGSTGLVPNAAQSKFGHFKTDITQHIFNIGGTTVEQYFSPSDHTNSHILDAISSANDDLYFGVYTFTEVPEADSIVSKIQNQHVYTAGIIDRFSKSYAAYPILNPVMTNALKVYSQSTSIYHCKMLIADPCSPNSDPLVETGSHNWTESADTKNDENTVIIHNDTIANIYYQSFYQNFLDLGGILISCPVSPPANEINDSSLNIYPNPANESVTIKTKQSQFTIYNLLGEDMGNWQLSEGENKIETLHFPEGIYFLSINNNGIISNKKLIISH